jgi:hypothetical protein
MRVCLVVFVGVSLAVSSAKAQICSGNNDFQGPYLLVASRNVATPPPAGGTPAPHPAAEYSKSAIGELLKGAGGTAPFGVTARIIPNGQGELLAAGPDLQFGTTRVGTYRVNGDCTMSMTIADGFATSLDVLGQVVTRGDVSFQGILQDRNNEANLIQTSPGSGTILHLERPHSAINCTNTTLGGIYGLIAQGVDKGTEEAPGETPFTMFGRFFAENGEFKLDTAALESTLPKRQITGTYKVEVDCTGTAKLIQDGRTLNASFVLLRGGVQFGAFQRAAMRLAFTDGRLVGTGEAR